MSIRNFIIILLIYCNFCFSQEKGEVYFIFEKTEHSLTDNVKNNFYNDSKFYISGECFKIKENKCMSLINKGTIKNLNILTIDDFLNNCKKRGMKYVFNPNLLYERIFILEDYNEEDYLVVEVEWKPSYLD